MDPDATDERAALLDEIDSHEAVLRRSLTRGGPNPLLDSGLTMQQLRVLVLLSVDGPLPQGDLAQALGVGLATVTGLVDRLVGRGLVERTENPGDRRVRRAALSPEGKELMERIVMAGQEARRRLLARIDLDALRGLALGLAALREALEQDGHYALLPPGVRKATFMTSGDLNVAFLTRDRARAEDHRLGTSALRSAVPRSRTTINHRAGAGPPLVLLDVDGFDVIIQPVAADVSGAVEPLRPPLPHQPQPPRELPRAALGDRKYQANRGSSSRPTRRIPGWEMR